ncbi:NADP-dependent phosphogluconate dehydrogenase, partial [Streptomyces niveiscabiei]|uniref:NADP-dependent phosphogluconate dehydrogenase n=1 Tax=Streptomyces niveiscabiei TaxID=164115 RepID=UPI0029B290C0
AEEFVAALERPRRLMLMVQAGEATDAVIGEFAPLLEPGDMIIDGGNAHFADTRRREAALKQQGIHFVGVGVSGGEEGALHGPSVMPGGSVESYAVLGPMFEAISAKVDGEPCATHIGADGAGHFVKMVHNGIEYADMQLIAEAYDLLRQVGGYGPAEIAGIFREWNQGRLGSYLIEITAEVLGHTDALTGGPFVDVVVDRAGQKGTGRWTVQTALDLASPVTAIAQATFARAASGQSALRAAYRGLPGGTTPPLSRTEAARFASQVENALYASKVIAYDQGWSMIQDAAKEYGWDIDLAAVARIWRGGCIIRASFLDRIRAAYAQDPALVSLLTEKEFAREITDAQVPWREIVATAARRGIPVPAFSAALAHYDTLRAERLPAALLQGQRDYFGAHTYGRVDKPG